MKAKQTKHSRETEVLIPKLKSGLNQLLSLLRFNITFKLTLGYTLHIASLLLFLFGLSYLGIAFFGLNYLNDKLSQQAVVIEQFLSDDGPASQKAMEQFLNYEQLKFYAETASGQLVKGSEPAEAVKQAAALQPAEMISPRQLIDLAPLVYKGSCKGVEDSVIDYTLVLSLERYQALRRMALTLGGLIWVLIVLASAAEMSRMAKQHLRPIHLMTAQVREISSNSLNVRLNVSGTRDELKDLALTFNRMLEEIEGNYEREKQFVSDASHELRTPISVIKGYANLLRRWGKSDEQVLEEGINAIVSESDNMQRLVEDLLFIARHEQNQRQVTLEPVNLSELLNELYKESSLIDQNHGFSAAIKPGVMVLASHEHLKQAFRIFIDNAIRYTPKGGQISIRLETSHSTALIVIQDTGIGIAAEDLPHIFDRFFRADKSRSRLGDDQSSGSGLGLAIAKIIIERHQAKVCVESVVNGGTEVSILMPLII